MELSILQIVFITLIAYLKMTDTVTTQLFAFNTIICGWLTGLVVGDPTTGLSIGATMQLMSMGVVAVGGSSMPDYPIAAIMRQRLRLQQEKAWSRSCHRSSGCHAWGNFDVIYKIFNGFLMRKETSLIEEGKFQSALNMIKISPVFLWSVLRCSGSGLYCRRTYSCQCDTGFHACLVYHRLNDRRRCSSRCRYGDAVNVYAAGKILVLPAGRLCVGSLSEGTGAWVLRQSDLQGHMKFTKIR